MSSNLTPAPEALTEAVLALSGKERSALIDTLLAKAVECLMAYGENPTGHEGVGALSITPSLISLAGFANAQRKSETTEAVGDVLELFQGVIRSQALSNLSPETQARIAAGEDPEKIAEEMLAAKQAADAAESPVEVPSYGMYL